MDALDNGADESEPRVRARRGPRRLAGRRTAALVAVLVLAGLLAVGASQLDLHRIGHALITASPGWVALAVVLMAASLLLRSVSWQQTLRAALPDTAIRWAPVVRATMIGVMASALFPGRVGEPSRVVVLTRRLDGPTRRLLPVVAGTVFSQTLINLLALAVLAGVTFTSVPLLRGHPAGIAIAIAIPLAAAALVVSGPRMLARGRDSPRARVARASVASIELLALARRGLVVFARPRHGAIAVAC
jgi:phosphatidyl-myo-inositol alpha-mannosyltransferase